MITTDVTTRTTNIRQPALRHLSTIALAGLGLAAVASTASQAGCSEYDGVTGEVCLTAGSYCPKGTLPADGRLMQIETNTVLYSVIGPTYGGDGMRTFALPDLRGRVPVGQGRAPGLSGVEMGEKRGSEEAHPDKTTVVTAGGKPDTVVSVPSSVPLINPQLGLRYCIVVKGLYPMRPDQ